MKELGKLKARPYKMMCIGLFPKKRLFSKTCCLS